jgi:hypothetical protein
MAGSLWLAEQVCVKAKTAICGRLEPQMKKRMFERKWI